jgi:hypothetical protein
MRWPRFSKGYDLKFLTTISTIVQVLSCTQVSRGTGANVLGSSRSQLYLYRKDEGERSQAAFESETGSLLHISFKRGHAAATKC